MNSNLEKCAIIELHHGQFKIIEPGDYVLCSITKQKIPLENLKYYYLRIYLVIIFMYSILYIRQKNIEITYIF